MQIVAFGFGFCYHRIMKCFLAIILIIGIASVTAGFLIMDHDGDCFLSSVIGGNCLDRSNIFEFFGVHLNFLKIFSDGLLASVVAFLLFLVFVFSNLSYRFNNSESVNYLKNISLNLGVISLKIKLFRWFSLLENSPSSI